MLFLPPVDGSHAPPEGPPGPEAVPAFPPALLPLPLAPGSQVCQWSPKELWKPQFYAFTELCVPSAWSI